MQIIRLLLMIRGLAGFDVHIFNDLNNDGLNETASFYNDDGGIDAGKVSIFTACEALLPQPQQSPSPQRSGLDSKTQPVPSTIKPTPTVIR